MKVVITGGAGFLGHHVAIQLNHVGYKIIIVDNLSRARSENLELLKKYNIPILREDILSENILKIINEYKPECVVHAAALTSVEESLKKPDLYNTVNSEGTLRMLQASKEAGVKHFIYISSAAVYGDPEYLPIDEEHPLNPKSPYGTTKLEGEAHTRSYFNYGLKTTVLRLFNIYGPRQNPSYAGVITTFLESLREKKPPTIFGDGTQTRDFVYISDVVEAIEKAVESEANGVFNIGSGRTTSINSLAETMIKLSGLNLKPEYCPSRASDIRQSYANIDRANKYIKWNPKTILEEGLKLLMKSNST